MGRLEALARSCHPLPSVAVTVVATVLAAAVGRSAAGLVAVAAAVLAGQLSVGWLNDLLDAGRDARVGRADKPVATGVVSRRVVAVATVVAAVAAVGLSLLSGVDATLLHVVMLCSAWAYDLGVKAMAFSVVPYALSFGLLPAFVTLGGPDGRWPPLWLMAAAAVLGSAAHFANVIPDLDDDAATGVRGLPHRIGGTASACVAAALAVITGVVLAVGPPGPVTAAGLVAVPLSVLILVLGRLRGRRPGSRANFTALLAVAVLDVALLIITGGVELGGAVS
ncbi:UbiA family prenyltransferase [Lentzea sp. NPDC042327]|uniref:UbiA family prenyltransferase n=1 Tax=Lentzea sp. NPDC042327 TaxID=3154801 RepID=UPI0033F3FE01